MLNFSKIKIIAILIFCALAIFFALPSFLISNQNIDQQITESQSSKLSLNFFINKILPDKKINLGLDLQGGSQLMIEVDFEYYLREQLEQLREDLSNNFQKEALRTVFEVVGNKIIFNISDNLQIKSAKNLLKNNSLDYTVDEDDGKFQIYFSDVELRKMRQKLIAQSIEIIRRRVDENGTKEPSIQAQGNNRILLQVPGLQNSDELKQLLGQTAKLTFHFLANDNNNFSSQNFVAFDQSGRGILLNKDVVLSGDLLIDANATYHEGSPAVFFRFNAVGARKFAQITKDNIGRIFAIVLDGMVITAPKINSAITQGSGVISGNFTTQQANQVSLLLRAGALVAPLKIIEERSVGPSLGVDSIRSGKISSLMAIVFVAIFMIIFYGLFGIFANLALLINIAIIIACLAILGATLTLPGIAGIILTMGMAVDANVLIFERIKEELRENKSVFIAVEQGFDQAYRTIIDSNLTTLIVAFFLYVFGNGAVKGFAVTLGIGITASMFSSISLSRMMIAIWLKKFRPKKLNLL